MKTSDHGRAFVALGSNIKPTVRHLLAALHNLSRVSGVQIEQVSKAYLSEAHTTDRSVQSDYLNAVAYVHTDLDPAGLLYHCLEIERSLGRDRNTGGRWGPRTIDLDILLHSAGPVEGDSLKIPHPRMRERLFVLLPLADIVGHDRFFDDLGESMSGLLDGCPDSGRIVRTIVDLNNYK
jgi:2-amino-4-hydroxy-6-hydroxymethyldihydropteridine diphosphokinase